MLMTLEACTKPEPKQEFRYIVDQFADIKVMRYQVPGFADSHAPSEEARVLPEPGRPPRPGYHLSTQNGAYNLAIRKTLDAVVSFEGRYDRPPEWAAFMTYTKQVWFSNGIYHHYGNRQIRSRVSLNRISGRCGLERPGPSPDPPGKDVGRSPRGDLSGRCSIPRFFRSRSARMHRRDMVQNSAVTFYRGVTEKEATAVLRGEEGPQGSGPAILRTEFPAREGERPARGKDVESGRAVWPGNQGNRVVARTCTGVAENDHQKHAIETLIDFYTTGDLKTLTRIIFSGSRIRRRRSTS